MFCLFRKYVLVCVRVPLRNLCWDVFSKIFQCTCPQSPRLAWDHVIILSYQYCDQVSLVTKEQRVNDTLQVKRHELRKPTPCHNFNNKLHDTALTERETAKIVSYTKIPRNEG